MKNYFYKYIVKGLALTMLLAISSSLFAISFNETRTVVIPRYSNAVYRSLNVLDKMFFETDNLSNRVFLLELGKRPTYFWDQNKMFYLYQSPTVTLSAVNYNHSTVNQDVLTVDNINLGTGSFIAKGMFLDLADNPILSINTSDAYLFMGYNGIINTEMHFGNNTNQYNVFSNLLGFVEGTCLLDSTNMINGLYVRDLEVGPNLVKFPSPRMMVYQESGYTRGAGTAADFALANPDIGKAPQHYYGPWETWGPSGKHGQLTTTLYPCSATGVTTPNRCAKIQVTCSTNKGSTDPIGCTMTQTPDTFDQEFICTAGKPYEPGTQTSGTFDPPDTCYDYQHVPRISNASPNNNNNASYEFKVEEIYRIHGTQAELIAQTPEVRVDSSNKPVALMKRTGSSWTFNNVGVTSSVIIDGVAYSIGNFVNTYDTNPCYTLCNGKLCSSNILYVRGGYTSRELKGGANSAANTWPIQEGEQQNLRIHTYTVGFCPQKLNNNDYLNYEVNYQQASQAKLLESLTPGGSKLSMCMRRQVQCNKISGDRRYKRSYKLLSTDH